MSAVELSPVVRGADPRCSIEQITAAFLQDMNQRRAELEQIIATVDCCTYNIDSIADELGEGPRRGTTGPGGGRSQLAEEVLRAQESLGRGKRLLDRLKAEGNALARSHPGSQRVTAFRASYGRLAQGFVEATKAHQAAKERVRAMEVNALVDEALVRAGNPGGGPSGSQVANVDELRRAAARDPAAFALQLQAQQVRQRPPPPANGTATAAAAAFSQPQAYDDASARAREIQVLVRSTLEVQELMRDVSTLVAHQAEGVDTVEAHAEQAGLHVLKANDQLEAAVRKRRYRRKCCCGLAIAGLFLTVLGIIALSLFITGTYKALIP